MKSPGSSSDGVGRRVFLSTAAATLGGAVVAGQVPPGGTPHVKGPAVWLDLDQQELDDAYDQTVYAPNRLQILGRFAANSETVRRRLGPPRRMAYGPTAIEQLDIFLTDRPNAPVHVFVHGGAWRGGFAKDYAFLAETFVRAGAHFVVLDFDSVIDTGGDLTPMVDQVRRGIAWVSRNARSFGGDPTRLFVSGHSSGAHLAGVALVTDWEKAFMLPSTTVRGGLLCSGMYDIKPVRLSSRSSYVTITDGIEEALSAQRHLSMLKCPLVLAYGTLETPEFQRQTRDFAAALGEANHPVTVHVGELCNHFEVIETMSNPYGLLGVAALEQMGLA